MPEEVDECVRSVMEENPDWSEERARKVCHAAKNKGHLEDGSFDASDPIGVFLAAPSDDVRVALSSGLSGGRPIERVEEGDKVRYTNVMLLGPGEWTDSASRTTIFYAPDAIKRSADNWIDPRTGDSVDKAPLNHYHEHDVPAENVGHIDVSTADVDDEGHLYADVVFHRRTQRSREMEEMMQLAMEEGGQEGLGGVSVEIPDDETEWDDERRMERMEEMWFSGAGLVMNPASATVDFANQSARAALSAPGSASRSLFVPSTGATPKTGEDAQGGMGDDNPHDPDEDTPDDLGARFREMRERVTRAGRELQNETDMALNAISEYLAAEENSPDDPLTAFREWAAEALDEPMVAAVEAAIQSFADAGPEDQDPAELTVADLQGWAEGATTEPEEPGEPEDPEELADDEEGEPGEPDAGMGDDATVMEVADTLESVIDTMERAVSQLSEEVSAVEDRTAELQEAIAEQDKRLNDLADEPNTRTLGGGTPPTDEDEEEDHRETTAPSVSRTRDGYISGR